jgi:hypothetical protein
VIFPLLREHSRSPSEITVSTRVPHPHSRRWRATRAGDVLDRRMRAERDGIGRRASFRCMAAVRPFAYHIRLPWLQFLLAALAAHYLCSSIRASFHFADYGAARLSAFRLAHPPWHPPPRAPAAAAFERSPAGAAVPPPPRAVRVTVRLLRRGCLALEHTFDARDSAPLTLREPVIFDGVELQVSPRAPPPVSSIAACLDAPPSVPRVRAYRLDAPPRGIPQRDARFSPIRVAT